MTHISKTINIIFPDFYLNTLFPTLFSCFPSVLYDVLTYQNKMYELLKKEGKEPKDIDNDRMFERFLTFIQLAIFKDLKLGIYLYPKVWTRMKFKPEIEIFFEFPQDINEMDINEIKALCKKHKITTTNKNEQQLIESIKKKHQKNQGFKIESLLENVDSLVDFCIRMYWMVYPHVV